MTDQYDNSLSQKERYDSTQVPLSQVFTPDNKSQSTSQGDADANMNTGSDARGASYGETYYAADNSVAPVTLVMSPNITKGNSGQRSHPSAAQDRTIDPVTLALIVGIPVGAYLLVKWLRQRDTTSSTGISYTEYVDWW